MKRNVNKSVDNVSNYDYIRGMTAAELKRMLSKQGATFVEGKGSHLKVKLHGKQSVIPIHKGDLPTGTLNGILKQLGLK